MIRLLDKETEMHLLEQLFDLLHENMSVIAPSQLPYAEEKQQWLSEVAPALAKAPRQIVLMYDAAGLAGYLQYYVNKGLFMVEEIQLRKDRRVSSCIVSLWKFLSRILPEDVHTIEAYADPRNQLSRKLMAKLGMEVIEDRSCGNLLHYRGRMDVLRTKKASPGGRY